MGRGKRVEQVLSSLPEPSDSQQVVVVTGLPGGNLLNVQSADGRAFQCLTISRVTRMSTTSPGTTAYFATRALRSPTKRSEPYASQNCPGRTCM